MAGPQASDDPGLVADRIIDSCDGRVVLGLPLGLGKAGRIANALYRRAAADPSISLDIFTALTLEPPGASSDMEKRFAEPLVERLFGTYERLDYVKPLRAGKLPANIRVSEFFLLAGRWIGVDAAQQAYVSANYTHAARMLLDKGVNVIAQLVARRGEGEAARYSLSCNTDITLDLIPMLRAQGRRFILAGEVSRELPFMGGEAVLPSSDFDLMLDRREGEPGLFVLPKQPVSEADHAVGIHAASLVPDGGTIQIGIGSLGDAFTAALIMRHEAPDLFAQTLAALCGGAVPAGRHTGPFRAGLYGASEMFVDGFMDLYRAGILRRKAADGALLHAGFFLGSSEFYRFLRELPDAERDLFSMRGISFVNEIYGNEEAKRADRVDARFVNSAMMVTLLGDAVSDGLENGQVVSGVGGQYNFVTQAFALEGARSILTLNATRTTKGRRGSRLVWRYGHTTIPRHLRDVVVTEYGVAELRGRSDSECIAAMVAIADDEFADGLMIKAREAGKIEKNRVVKRPLRNTPETISRALRAAREAGYCHAFPLGTDFTPAEQKLLPALGLLRNATATRPGLAQALGSALFSRALPAEHHDALVRMDLAEPKSLREAIYRRLLLWALDRAGEKG